MIEPHAVARALAEKGIVADESQQRAIGALCTLLDDERKGTTQHTYQGVYCHGLPGRGKSLIVDTVYALVPCAKRRIHFHQFIRDVNRLLVQAPKSDDRLGDISRAWLKDVDLLYFDEFHVHDIADALLMGRLLETALACGTRIVLTSNYSPRNLLPDPEFHERFEPTIERIERHFEIIAFDGERDYREHSEASGASGTAAGKQLVWVDFDALCVSPRSHLDYLALAERWRGVIVDRLDTEMLKRRDVLQRFVWFVDILYDGKHALFIASDRPIRAALVGPDGAHDISRTTSRLAEMQSHSYASNLVRRRVAAPSREAID